MKLCPVSNCSKPSTRNHYCFYYVSPLSIDKKWENSISQTQFVTYHPHTHIYRQITIKTHNKRPFTRRWWWRLATVANVLPRTLTPPPHSPRSTFRSWWLWHLRPWQPRFCTSDGQCLPPFCGFCSIIRVRDIMPVPHVVSHSLHGPHSLTRQSITAKQKREQEKNRMRNAIKMDIGRIQKWERKRIFEHGKNS